MGWYPDPAGSGQERYWDGANWTENLRPSYSTQQNYQQPQAGYSYGYGAGYATVAASVPSTADGVPLAGWWSRVGASILDSILLGIVGNILVTPFSIAGNTGLTQWAYDLEAAAEVGADVLPNPFDPAYGLIGPMMAAMVISMLVSFAYGFLMLRFKGATLGQMALGIGVVPTDRGLQKGGLGWGQAALRHGAYVILNQIPLVGFISILMPLWTQKRQTLHDMIGKTQVVRTR